MLSVIAAPPFLSVQDLGRPGHRRLGIPESGAMDRWALQAANLLVGNARDAPALEWGVGGGTLRFARAATIALTGAAAVATLNGVPVEPWRAVPAAAGALLTVTRLYAGRFLYIAVDGGLALPRVLGSAATYLPATFGGLAGRLLRNDDLLPLSSVPASPVSRDFVCPTVLRRDAVGHDVDLPPSAGPLRVVAGPQVAHLDSTAWDRFLNDGFALTAASDRTGYRLHGPPVHTTDVATLPSEASCPGAVQVPPNGQPIVLMADAPTVGGYPKPAVVCQADLGRLAQHVPGDPVRFVLITVQDAQRAYRRCRVALHTLATLAGRR